ncbi:mercury(II) reductase [Marinitoga aeolica]|uniref:Mercury(II) reductase n=1 Tax=Marinitoga aeolica TaxID=2809031 RepID=A0ABY8PPM1_9BACT|nr:mercury(II) reductase [Marinitoga aeolica]WGS64572.1 mercury(II) reductase [Marinitoga aeolica]
MKYDLIIIGGGAAGFAAAMKANELNKKVLIINDNNNVEIGGTCVNVGCFPTKHMLYKAELIHKISNNIFDGITANVKINYEKIVEEKNKLVENAREEKYKKVLSNLENVDFVNGKAEFIDNNSVIVNGEKYFGEKFLIATGSKTFIPPIKGIEKVKYLTNKTALELKKIPEKLIVIGAGALGLEFAQMFSRFGSKVTIIEATEHIMGGVDNDFEKMMNIYFKKEGIKIIRNVKIKEIKNKKILFENNETMDFDDVLIATGRISNTDDLGLENTNIKLGKKHEIIVDKYYQADENIWAAGDVIGNPMLETVAAKEGFFAVNNMFLEEKKKIDYDLIPYAIFTDPQFASVGITENEAKKRKLKFKCNFVKIENLPKALAIKDTKGAIRLVVDSESETIIGIQLMSPMAADIIHEATMIVKNKMNINEVINTVHIFPTLSEIIKLGAQDFKRDITKMSCCVE